MKKNVSGTDGLIRTITGVVLCALYFGGIVNGVAGVVLVIAGVVLVFTSLMNFCPLYAIFGINTCRAKKSGRPVKSNQL